MNGKQYLKPILLVGEGEFNPLDPDDPNSDPLGPGQGEGGSIIAPDQQPEG